MPWFFADFVGERSAELSWILMLCWTRTGWITLAYLLLSLLHKLLYFLHYSVLKASPKEPIIYYYMMSPKNYVSILLIHSSKYVLTIPSAWMAMSVYWNISTAFGCIAMSFCTNIHGPRGWNIPTLVMPHLSSSATMKLTFVVLCEMPQQLLVGLI